MANINTGLTGTVNVPGALHSTADSNVVAYTGDIVDDNLNKNQSTVNAEVLTTFDTKVNVDDIVDNLTSEEINKPLSANMGKLLKTNIDSIVESGVDAGYLMCSVSGSTLEFNFSVGNNYKTFLAVNGNTLNIQSNEVQS